MTLGGVGMYVMSVALPAVQAEFGTARAGASLPYTVTMIGFGLGGILMGRLADRYGVVVPVIVGALCLGGGFVVAGLSQSLAQFTLAHGFLIAPVKVGSRIRGHFERASAEERDDGTKVVWHVTIESDGERWRVVSHQIAVRGPPGNARPEPDRSEKPKPAGRLINVNTATQAELEALAKEAHEKVCPYSHATRGNVPIEFEVVGG